MTADPTDPNEPTERNVTSDPDRIREWAESRDAVPVTVMGGEAADPEYTFRRRSEVEPDHEEQSWEEFTETIEREELVFVYGEEEPTGEDLGSFELAERAALVDRVGLEDDEVEEALRAGETVTTELVETRVVEREIVETDTIESEVIGTEVLERTVVASEILERDVEDVEFLDDTDSGASPEMGEPERETIEVTVDERRMDTIEEIEQLTVESRVVGVDVDVDERETVDVDQAETTVADETIHRAILEGGILSSEDVQESGEGATGEVDELLEGDRIRTTQEGETFQSRLIERRTLEEEVRDRRRMRFTLAESEIVETEVTGSSVIDAELVDVEEYVDAPEAMAGGEAGGVETSPGTDATTEERSDAGAETPVEITADDQGKAVVDETGEQVGMVADVEDDMVYIDPEPGLVDRLRARFDWGEPDRDAYPVERTQFREITDDEVVLESE